MNKFYFEAADQDGNRVSGHITAEDETQARKILQEKKFAIFSIQLSKQESKSVEAPTDSKNAEKEVTIAFEFEGKDKDRAPIHGTIAAPDLGAAYKTLKLQYNFDVTALFENDLPAEKKEQAREAGISQELADWFEIEAIKEAKRAKKRITKAGAKTAVVTEEQKKTIKELQGRIYSIVSEAVALLNKNSEFLDPIKKREINDRLDLLSRLKQTNAVEHLKNLTDRVLKDLQDDAIFLKNIEDDQVWAKKEEFKLFSDEHGQNLQKTLLNIPIDIDLESIDLDVLRLKLKRIRIVKEIAESVYMFFAIVAGLSLLFWAFVLILTGIMQSALLNYFLLSGGLWAITYISIAIALIYAPLFAQNTFSQKQSIFYFVGGFIFLCFALIQFHGIFFWTI